MPRGPAARILDPVLHPLPGMLTPGPGSFNTIIGGKLAWRGVPAAAAGAITAAKATSDATIKTAEAATVAAAVPPAFGLPAAKAAEETVKATAAATMGSMIAGAAGGADIHACTTPLPIPPHGPGVVIDGSPTVLINTLPACRQGDTIIEAVGPPDKILMGCLTVIIGDAPGVSGPPVVTGLGADVDALIAKSDSLSANLKALTEGNPDKWTIVWGPAGKQSTTDNASHTITLNSDFKGNPIQAVGSLSHESGHALYTAPYIPPDGLTKDQYVSRNVNEQLKGEGEANLMTAQVRNEINSNGGPDIGNRGQQAARYTQIAAKDHSEANRDAARQEMADIFRNGETVAGVPYGDYYAKPYADFYDAHPPAHPPPGP
jgi:uncharacterized Zn-binding protein involved in type VI secretion